jgi:hypothetical protein
MRIYGQGCGYAFRCSILGDSGTALKSVPLSLFCHPARSAFNLTYSLGRQSASIIQHSQDSFETQSPFENYDWCFAWIPAIAALHFQLYDSQSTLSQIRLLFLRGMFVTICLACHGGFRHVSCSILVYPPPSDCPRASTFSQPREYSHHRFSACPSCQNLFVILICYIFQHQGYQIARMNKCSITRSYYKHNSPQSVRCSRRFQAPRCTPYYFQITQYLCDISITQGGPLITTESAAQHFAFALL